MGEVIQEHWYCPLKTLESCKEMQIQDKTLNSIGYNIGKLYNDIQNNDKLHKCVSSFIQYVTMVFFI